MVFTVNNVTETMIYYQNALTNRIAEPMKCIEMHWPNILTIKMCWPMIFLNVFANDFYNRNDFGQWFLLSICIANDFYYKNILTYDDYNKNTLPMIFTIEMTLANDFYYKKALLMILL